MAFKSRLAVSDAGFGKSILLEPLEYYSERYKRTIIVPKGFVTDYASIPRLFQLFISKLGRHRKAAVVHDYLYNSKTQYRGIHRAAADYIFLDGMKAEGVPRWKRYSMFNAVRLFGGFAGFRR